MIETGVPCSFLTPLITRLRDAGITHVVLGTSYQAEVFEQYFGDGSRFGVDLKCIVETEALGTGGGIRNVAPALRADTVLVFNGDNLIGVELSALLDTHRAAGADVTLCLHRVADPRAIPIPIRRGTGMVIRTFSSVKSGKSLMSCTAFENVPRAAASTASTSVANSRTIMRPSPVGFAYVNSGK